MTAFDSPIVSPVLIGREAALAFIDRLAAEARSGAGRAVLISGEPGIGKSRLLSTLAGRYGEEGWAILTAACYDEDRGLPFAAVSDLLSGIIAREGAAMQPVLQPHAGVLARLLPQLRSQIPPSEPGSAPETDQDRRQLVTALRDVLIHLCAVHPCFLQVDDLHWADEGTLECLLRLARTLDDLPILLLLTFRSDEVSPGLEHMLAAMERERLGEEFRLERLSLTEVDLMLQAALGRSRSIRSDFLQTLYQLTEGNPFFVEELLRFVLGETGGSLDSASLAPEELRIPRSVREAVTRRVTRLSLEARHLLQVAAVAGIRFDLNLLMHVLDIDESRLLQLVRELLTEQLVVEAGDDRFSFRHALTREAIRSELLGAERRLLSRRIAFALEAIYGDDTRLMADELAYHFWEAREWDKALVYCRIAGEQALSMYAPARAIGYLNHAIEASQRLGANNTPLLLLRAAALEATASFEGARADYEAAIKAAEAGRDTRQLQEALLGLGLLWSARDYQKARPLYERAVRLARETGEQEGLAHALKRLGNWYSNAGFHEESRRLLDESLAIFRAHGDRRGEAETLDLMGMTTLMGADLRDSCEFFKQASVLYEELNDKRGVVSSLATIPVLAGQYQTSVLEPALPLREAIPYGERSLAIARQLDMPTALSYALWQLGFALAPAGDFQRALDYAREALNIAREAEHTQWMAAAGCVLGAIHTSLLDRERSMAYLNEAQDHARQVNSELWICQSASLLVEAILLDKASVAAAEAVIRPLASRVRGGIYRSMPEVWVGSAQVEIELAAGRFENALVVCNRLASDRPPGTRLKKLRAAALLGLGRDKEALRELTDARAIAIKHDNVSLLWRIEAELASIHLKQGHREAARDSAANSQAVIDQICGSLTEEALAAGFAERAPLYLPAALRRRGGKPSANVLTAREAEIAACVARGMTNRAIADELVLSTRTVETHIANALSKLGFSARSQLATWATEHRPSSGS